MLQQLAELPRSGPPKRSTLAAGIARFDEDHNFALSGCADAEDGRLEWALVEGQKLRTILAQAWRLSKRTANSQCDALQAIKHVWSQATRPDVCADSERVHHGWRRRQWCVCTFDAPHEFTHVHFCSR